MAVHVMSRPSQRSRNRRQLISSAVDPPSKTARWWTMRSLEEQAQIERFSKTYLCAQTPTMRAIERRVCGCDYGGTSWTTREQCEQISALLELRPGMRLLDVGAGSGWPGLYLAGPSGCDTVLVDLPLAGL